MDNCIFCKIAEKKIPSKVVYEDELVFAFEDIEPQAPVHILIVPKKHFSTILELKDEDYSLVSHLVKTATKIAADRGVAEKGFRIVTNCNPESGQSVYHIHFHLLGGRQMHWPPG
ncbi:histidine triad nucleotide-binding protein [Thermodesulfovibrionales bacterium]|nr:histidine triad nucleotide-binding protein [Thermodesulfovibrionales bacterium]MCL0074763.1 histidine triad nucleotide-binding protein [Thermodesulfovibrionales bacterium]MCL0084745.1 histidine triad nucleotide-binding protein [Thermodesulfovibrionales bacterium]MCL0096122.1 histidine triad nucleotide-binding protein [Thermodesulfovibrionales bacterium]